MTDKNLKELEDIQQYEDSSNELPPNDIVTFNELKSCANLLRLYQTTQLEIQPDFKDILFGRNLTRQGLLTV